METRLDSKPAGTTVLIVDDEFGVLEVLEFFLTDLGYTVLTALNGRDALARVKQARPDVIVLDLMMPVMDGTAVLKALAADPEHRSIPVIVTSALPEETVKQRCTGYSVFLRKPYRTEPLLEAIERLLKQPVKTPAAADLKPKS
jgi:CheY-like chemotaxis protein